MYSKDYMVKFCNSQMPLNTVWEPFWNYSKPKLNKFEEILANHYKYYLGDSLNSVTVSNTSDDVHPHTEVLGAIEEIFKEMYGKNIRDCI